MKHRSTRRIRFLPKGDRLSFGKLIK